jgi:hypothetical protein|nr:MAG TPA: NAD-dependent DNA ligase C4 zinc finger domain [Caudoviricetes sp.]
MKNYRMSKGTTEHYTSFKDLRESWGLPKITNKTRDTKKLKKQQESFLSKHICRACGNPLTYTGGNIMTCTNPDCKGIKIEREDKEGNVITSYITSVHLLDSVGEKIAHNIFSN